MKPLQCLGCTAIFALGTLFGATVDAGKNERVDASMYRNQEPATAAESLLAMALKQAGKGTWERIAVGQIHYLNGDQDKAEEIFASIKKKDSGDWMRMGRIYSEPVIGTKPRKSSTAW